MKRTKEDVILSVSNRLFLQNGYQATTMRKIAQEAGVSLGLATYFFKNKRHIAVRILQTYLKDLRCRVSEAVDIVQQPLLHSATMVRICDVFFMSPDYRAFFLDCLLYDIYMESMEQMGTNAYESIMNKYHISENPDLVLLSDNYIPPSIERVLILEKEKGNFPGISLEEIPEIVFSASVARYNDREEIREAIQKAIVQSREIVPHILAGIPSAREYSGQLFPAAH